MGTVDSFEPVYFGIKKKAIQAWIKLSEAQDKYIDYPCKNNSYFYMDYDGRGFEDEDGHGNLAYLTEDQAEELCADCPLLKQCYDFAVANEETHGVWGGINFGAASNEDKLF